MKNFELDIHPVESYEAPQLPTFGESNPELLKKMPSRWQANTKIIASLGLIGAFAFSGCVNTIGESSPNDIDNNLGHVQSITVRNLQPNNVEHNLGDTHANYNGYSEADLLVRLHTGGSGGSGYMVHLTEQEAFGIIQARLEAAGLVFGAIPPEEARLVFTEPQVGEYDDETGWFLRSDYGDVELDLFDAQKDVGITYVNWLGEGRAFMPSERELAQRIEEIFAEQVSDIIVGAFYNPGIGAGGEERPSNEEVEETRPILERQLINQADKFILRLQSEGILERFPAVYVTINDMPLSLNEYPLIINNQVMAPALELFKALEMNVVEDINEWRIAIIGTKNDVEVRASVGITNFNRGASITVSRDGNSEWPRDIPVLKHNDIILVPIQYVADLVGAAVEWNEDTRTIKISY